MATYKQSMGFQIDLPPVDRVQTDVYDKVKAELQRQWPYVTITDEVMAFFGPQAIKKTT
jgi:hypothetical protein